MTSDHVHDLDDTLAHLSKLKMFRGLDVYVFPVSWSKELVFHDRNRCLGNCWFDDDKVTSITVSPVLDNEWVPSYVIRDVVAHELIHAFMGPWTCDHPTSFLKFERRIPGHKKASAWISANIHRLFRGY